MKRAFALGLDQAFNVFIPGASIVTRQPQDVTISATLAGLVLLASRSDAILREAGVDVDALRRVQKRARRWMAINDGFWAIVRGQHLHSFDALTAEMDEVHTGIKGLIEGPLTAALGMAGAAGLETR